MMPTPLSEPASRRLHVVTVPAWFPTQRDLIAGSFVVSYLRAFESAGITGGVVFPDLIHWRQWKGLEIGLAVPRLNVRRIGESPVVEVSGMHTALGQPALQMWRYERWLRRGLQAYRRRFGTPDVIHAHCAIPAGWAAVRCGARLDRPVVITEHTGPFSLALRPPAARRFALSALRRADVVVAVSEVLEQQMRQASVRRPIRIIRNPVCSGYCFAHPPALERGGSGRPLYRVLFVGRLVREKGVFELVDAAARLAADPAMELEWHIVGRGPAGADMQRAAPDMRFHGALDADGVRRVMAQAHLLVLPSHWENCPLVVEEALSLGRPVVATRGTGCAELIGARDGLLHEVGNVSELTGQIRAALRGYAQWDHADIAARAALRFDSRVIGEAYRRVFEQMVHAQRQPRPPMSV